MFDRRAFLMSGAAGGVALALPLRAFAAPAETHSAELAALFDALFQEQLRTRPESATQLGLDKGPNADLRSKLTDESEAGRAAAKARNQADIRRLLAVNPASLSPADRVNWETVLYTRRSTAAVQAFDFGGFGYGPSPYVVSQLTGAYQSVPDFLDTKHPIDTAADADAYLSRLTAFATQLDDETARMRHDAGLGVSPPDFILDTTLDQMSKTRVASADAVAVRSIARRAAAKGLPAHYGIDAASIWDSKIVPALDRQLAFARSLRAKAVHDAGIWRFKDGPAFYETALHTTTTTRLSPAEVHKFGLDQAKAISARLDGLLKAQGMTRGTIGERMAALYKDPSQLYPNTDAGKAEAIAYCNARLAAIRTRLPSRFNRLPPYQFEVRRVPPQTEAGAASAFSQGPALDGSRPGLVYFNLHDTAEWPKFCLATTVYPRRPARPSARRRPRSVEQGPAADPQDRRLLRLCRGLGALCRAARGRDGHVRRRSARPARLPQVPAVPRQPLRRRHRHPSPALEPRAGDPLLRRPGRRGAGLRDPRGRALLRHAGPGVQLQARAFGVHRPPRESPGRAGRRDSTSRTSTTPCSGPDGCRSRSCRRRATAGLPRTLPDVSPQDQRETADLLDEAGAALDSRTWPFNARPRARELSLDRVDAAPARPGSLFGRSSSAPTTIRQGHR